MIYVNNAATSFPKPQNVYKKIAEQLQEMPAEGVRASLLEEKNDIALECRKSLCSFFNADKPQNIIFTPSATFGLNLLIKGFLKNNDHVITTQAEHNSVLRPLKTLEKQKNISLSIARIKKDGSLDFNDLIDLFNNKTKMLIVNHASNVTGFTVDLYKLSEIAQKKNVKLIIDVSQSAGSVPIDISAIKADGLVFAGHKSLYGLRGIGGLYLKDNMDIEPLVTGGTGIDSENLFQPSYRPVLYEAGTQNIVGIASLLEGVNFINEKNIEKIIEKKKNLREIFYDELKKNKNIIIYGDYESFRNLPVFSINITNKDPEECSYILKSSFGIIVRYGLHCAPLIHKSLGSYPKGSLRFSFSFFNTEDHVLACVDALKRISKI